MRNSSKQRKSENNKSSIKVIYINSTRSLGCLTHKTTKHHLIKNNICIVQSSESLRELRTLWVSVLYSQVSPTSRFRRIPNCFSRDTTTTSRVNLRRVLLFWSRALHDTVYNFNFVSSIASSLQTRWTSCSKTAADGQFSTRTTNRSLHHSS